MFLCPQRVLLCSQWEGSAAQIWHQGAEAKQRGGERDASLFQKGDPVLYPPYPSYYLGLLFIEENIFGRHGGDFFLCHYICSIYQINLLCRIRK